METITNIASTATSTVSNLIYGNQDAATKTNETAGKEPVSGQIGKGTADEPYDQGNSESALEKNTTSTTGTTVVEPTGSIQKPEDLIDAYNKEAGATTTSTTTGSGSTATGITDKAGVTNQVWKPTDVDAVKPSVADPTAAPETGIGAQGTTESDATGKDTLWRGVDAYKDSSSTNPASKTEGPKGAVDPEPKNYSIGDLTSGKETPSKSVDAGTGATNTTSQTDSKTGESAISPPDLSTTSPGEKADFSADTHEPAANSGSLIGERAGHGGPATAHTGAHEEKKDTSVSGEKKSSSVSPSGDDDEKSGKMDKLKDKLKTKLHIGSKDH